MTNTFNTISDFQLKTASGVPISDRICCLDTVTASWTVTNSASTCSDNSNVGFITLTNGSSYTNKGILAKGTSDYTFQFYPCNSATPTSAQYTLNFYRQCSDQSDNYSMPLTRFKTTANAGSDQTIPFGASVSLGSNVSDVHTRYQWSSTAGIISNSDHLTVCPLTLGPNVYTVTAYDTQFPNCSDVDSVTITVKSPSIQWSDVQKSDGGNTCTLTGTLISSDTYTNRFHVTLTNTSIVSDIFSSDVSTPYTFVQTLQKPLTPDTVNYDLSAVLSNVQNNSDATVVYSFSCVRPYVTLPGGPSILEMLIRVFGFLFLFIFFGFVFYDR